MKIVISCAITGSIHTPSMSPHLPLTPDQVAADSIAAAEAGAAIIHLHARDPKDGRPTPEPNVFMQFLPRIKQSCDAIVNITTGGGQGMSIDERIAAAEAFSPEMTSLNMGSMNFGLFPMLNRYSAFEHEWERAHLENSKDFIFRNTFGDIGYAIQQVVEANRMSVVRDFCGHGIGRLFHDSPNVLHYGRRGEGATLKAGMFFTVEPMVNLGKPHVKVLSDGWTAVTRDKSLSAQCEHTIGVTEDGCEIFTASPAGLFRPN